MADISSRITTENTSLRRFGPHAVCFQLIILLVVLCLPSASDAQTSRAENNPPVLDRTFQLEPDVSEYFLDTWVITSSINLVADGRLIPMDEGWTYDALWGIIIFDMDAFGNELVESTIRVQYKRLPVGLRLQYYERILSMPDESFIDEGDTTLTLPDDVLVGRRAARTDLFGSSQLQRSGSISRGITVGSNQDASLESALRFELSGNITEDIEVTASLTDQSTPIQPDGSTQNLREFDQVFIRLRHERGALQLGDVDVRLRNSEFAQIERRLKGIEAQANFGIAGEYQASASVVRGRFRSMELNGRNGVQGPYRLTGSSGETFIIVLAGTERVYLNGQLLARGEENDYIIDYALGEVSFTNRRMISDNSRITVDFQYVTEQYNRTLLTAEAANNELAGGRLRVGATFVQESDSRQLNAEVGLTDEELRVLREAGANLDNAVISGADSVGFRQNADFVLYAKADTTFQGQVFEIFRAMPEDSSAVWRVRFSRVEGGTGSYRRSESTINGIVYEWVGPGRGSYEPFRRVPAPQQQRMLAVRGGYQLTRELELFGETAFSERDINRFSGDKETMQQALAYHAGMRLKPTETRFGSFSAIVQRRETQSGFTFFDRTRDVEFDRRWNLLPTEETRETLTDAELGLDISTFSGFRLGAGYLERPYLNSLRSFARIFTAEPGGPEYNQMADFVQSSYGLTGRESDWFRQNNNVSYSFDLFGLGFTPSLNTEGEIRSQNVAGSDSLDAGSFRFLEVSPGLNTLITDNLSLGLIYTYRTDETSAEGRFTSESETRTGQLLTTFSRDENLEITGSVIYREKTFSENVFTETGANRATSVLINTTADYRTRDRWLDLRWLYEAGTESKPLLQETYIEVGPELGNYVWIDLNGDGVQQIDEFFPAQTPNEGTFIRQFVPGDELIPVISVNTRLRTRLEPGNLFENPAWEHISLSSAFEIREQNQGGSISDILLLNLNEFLDNETTLEGRMFWQQELHMFRPNRDIDLRIRYDQLTGKNQRAAGLEELRNKTLKTNFSYRFGQFTQAGIELTYSEQGLRNERLSSRAYQIRSYEAEPFLRYAFSRSLQTSTGLRYGRKRDILPETPVLLTQYRVYGDLRWFFQGQFQTTARLEWRSNEVQGESSTLGLFELTDGAGLGSTWQWSLQGTYRISSYLRANVSYDGRTVADAPAVQIVRFTLNAVF